MYSGTVLGLACAFGGAMGSVGYSAAGVSVKRGVERIYTMEAKKAKPGRPRQDGHEKAQKFPAAGPGGKAPIGARDIRPAGGTVLVPLCGQNGLASLHKTGLNFRGGG